MSATVAFVGIGAMGMPMTAMLADHGYSVRTYDTNSELLGRAGELSGVTGCTSIQDSVDGAAFVFTCLPNDDVVRNVYLNENGIVESISSGSISIDCSTVSPSVNTEIAAAMTGRGASHLDAAMLGSVPQAKAGEIGFVIGGEPATFQRAAPLLDILGRFQKYAGPSGSANRIKLIHQALVAINAAAVAEAVALCLKTGADLDCFYNVVCNGGGFAFSRYFEKRVPRMRKGDFSPLFMLDLMTKDIALACKLSEDAGADTPLTERTLALFQEAQAAGWGGEDFSAIAHLYERSIGRAFRDDTE